MSETPPKRFKVTVAELVTVPTSTVYSGTVHETVQEREVIVYEQTIDALDVKALARILNAS